MQEKKMPLEALTKNTPTSEAELYKAKEALQGKKGVLIAHKFDNRKKRRASTDTSVHNNRRNPAKRKKVLYKMAYFALSIQSQVK